MKTSRQADRRNQPNTDRSSHAVRRQRTLAAFACESLEGRKLMTGFAGAAGMMGNSPADLGGMTGAGLFGTGDFHHHDRMASDMTGGGAGQADSTSSTDAQSTATTSSTGSADAHSTLAMKGRGGDRADSQFQRDGDDQSFGGFAQGDEMDKGFSRGGADDIPMGGPGGMGGQGDQGTPSTGNTQLDTDLTKLQTDSQAIHDKSQVTPALLASVRKDLEAIDKAKTGTADSTALKTLQTDEQTIFGVSTGTDGSTASSTPVAGSTASSTPTTPTKPTDAQIATLQADHDAVLKSQGVSQTLIDQLAADRLAVKTASNVTTDDQATLDADHKAIDADRTVMQTQNSSTAAATPAVPAATTSTTAAAATDATATTTATTADSTSAPAAAPAPTAAPDAASQVAPAPDASTDPAAPAPPTALDPTMTQVTSTAAPMAATGMDQMGHHGRPGFSHQGMEHHGGAGHEVRGMVRMAAHGRRGMDA